MRECEAKFRQGSVSLGGALLSLAVHAGDWNFAPSLALAEQYTDNVTTASSGEEGDFLTSLEPGASLTGVGRRLKLASYYRLQNRRYLDRSDLDDLTHYLGSNATIEVFEDNLFLDLDASMFPTFRETEGRLTNRNTRNVGANQVNVVTYGITPRFIYHAGTLAILKAQTSYSDTSNSQATTGDEVGAGGGKSENQSVRLESGKRFARYTWYVSHNRRSTSHDSGESDSNFRSTEVGNRYRVNRFFRIDTTFGDEDNSFTGDSSQRSGLTWSLGGTWTPSPRTRISGSFGKRSFGDHKAFEFSYRLRRVTVSGAYNEELRTSTEILRQQRVFATRDVFGNPIANPNPDGNIPVLFNNLGLTDQVFVSRRFNANLGFLQKRGLLSVNIYRTEDESTDQSSAQSNLGVGGTWTRNLGYRLSAGIQGDYQTRDGGRGSGNLSSLFISPFVSYRIGPHLTSRFNYTYAEETSDFGFNDFAENSVAGSLSYTF